jgi:hypothetical protein
MHTEFWWGNLCKWKDNIEVNLREIGRDGVDWTDPAQDRVYWLAFVKSVMNFLTIQKKRSLLTNG